MNDDSSSAPLKKCKKCPNSHPATDEYFESYKKKDGTRGLRPFCKPCAVAQRKAYNAARVEFRKERYQQNREEIRVKAKQRRENHLEETRARDRRSYAKRAEKVKVWQREYRKTHKDVVRETDRRRYLRHHEQRLKTAKAYRLTHREQVQANKKRWGQSDYARNYQARYHQAHQRRIIQRHRRYYATNRISLLEKKRAYHKSERGRMALHVSFHKRRAQKLAAGGSYTAQQLREQITRQKHRCYYCKVKLGRIHHIEHVIPLSRGGTNDIHNIVIACPECNLRKGARLPHEWPEGGRLL